MLSDEAYLIENMLKIADKDGNDVKFKLNSAQREVDKAVSNRTIGTRGILVPKARQEGVSSYVLARFYASCLVRRNVRAVVISHEQESTQRLLKRVHYYIENTEGAKPVIKNLSMNEITFPKTNSMFYIGTAGAKSFGRGDTITHLHCSEYAFWPDPKKIMTGLLQAVPKSGEIFIESTGNGLNDYYHRCKRAYDNPNSPWKLVFLPWHNFHEYTIDLTPAEEEAVLNSLDDTIDEPELAKVLTPGQLAWRRMKLDELSYDVKAFRQEYPMTLDECFQTSGTSIFHRVNYKPSSRWKKVDNEPAHILEGHPNPGSTYSLGADVAGGVGLDYSVIEVICLDTDEQVYEYRSNGVDPEEFAYKVQQVGSMFNAYLTVEQNNHGILTLAVLEKIYPSYLISQEGALTNSEERALFNLGHRTTQRNKPLMIGNLRAALAKTLTVYSPILFMELSTFIEDPDSGKLGAQDGCHDDTVMAIACAESGRNRAGILCKPTVKREQRSHNPFSFDAIMESFKNRGRLYPIPPQNLGRWS